MDHKKRIALVCASSKGLGKACAESLLKDNATVILCSHNKDNLEKTKAELEKKYKTNLTTIQCDLNNNKDIESMIKQIVKTHKTIHILINNNAGPKPGTFSDFTDKDFEEAHNKLILSVVRVNRLVLPLMKKQKFGRIINITSRTVKEPNPKLTLSSIYRVGVISLSKVLSKEYAKDNVFINSVAPGTFETERIDHLFKAWLKPGETIEEKKKEALAAIPSGKFGAPKELGNLVSFLASEQCTLTGTTIPIEGGISQVLW